MKRKVFFSFQYEDVHRAMVVRNSNVIADNQKLGFIDKANFEKVKRNGDNAIKKWINTQMDGTTVTVVLLGKNTNKSRWVLYEINQSIKKDNGIVLIDISKIKDFMGNITFCCENFLKNHHLYDWIGNDGYKNIGRWIEKAAENVGK